MKPHADQPPFEFNAAPEPVGSPPRPGALPTAFRLFRVTIRPQGAAQPSHDVFHVMPADTAIADIMAAVSAGASGAGFKVVERPETFRFHGAANQAAYEAAEREGCQFSPFAPARSEISIECRP